MERKMTILSYFTPNFIVLCTRTNRSHYENIFCENISSYLKDLPKLSHLEIFAHLKKKKNVCLNLMLAYDFVVFKV